MQVLQENQRKRLPDVPGLLFVATLTIFAICSLKRDSSSSRAEILVMATVSIVLWELYIESAHTLGGDAERTEGTSSSYGMISESAMDDDALGFIFLLDKIRSKLKTLWNAAQLSVTYFQKSILPLLSKVGMAAKPSSTVDCASHSKLDEYSEFTIVKCMRGDGLMGILQANFRIKLLWFPASPLWNMKSTFGQKKKKYIFFEKSERLLQYLLGLRHLPTQNQF
jgi:hypothetical protein